MRITDFGVAVVDGDTHITEWVEQARSLRIAAKMLEPVRQYVREGSTVIDAGANIGDHTVEYSQWVGANGRVFAIEPNPEAFDCLLYNTRSMRNVTLINRGVSYLNARCGFTHLDNAGASYCVDDDSGIIETITIDSLNLNDVSLLKADIEGYEERMLCGASETIRRCRPVLLLEVNDGALRRAGASSGRVIALVRDMKYRITPMTKINSWNDPQYDILCIPG